MSDAPKSYDQILRDIEACDASIVQALDRRADAYRALAAIRAQETDTLIAPPDHRDVIAAQQEASRGLNDSSIAAVFREIGSACEQLVEPQRIAYLGSDGSFAHVASLQYFGSSGTFLPCTATDAVLEEVAGQNSAFGVLPYETSSEGGVTATLLGLSRSEARIVGELTIPCSYHLVSAADPSEVDKIFGASHAVGACESFLRTHFPKALVIDVPSCDVAEAFVAKDENAAAVTTRINSERSALRCLHERIEDRRDLEVRFAIIGGNLPTRTGRDRTVVAVAAGDSPGALSDSLKPFAERGVNLTRVESRPVTDREWRYLFFVELDGHVTDRRVLTALEEVRVVSRYVRVLGSYARPE